MKITIIGHNACGKSTLAKKISSELEIPHLEIDRLWFTHGGDDTSREQTEARQRVSDKIHADVTKFLTENDSWVSDGFYSREQPAIAAAADHVVFIDIPLWRRQINNLKRIWNRKERHPELTIWDELYFTYDMIRRTRDRNPTLKKFCLEHKDKLVHLTSHQAVDSYFDSLYK